MSSAPPGPYHYDPVRRVVIDSEGLAIATLTPNGDPVEARATGTLLAAAAQMRAALHDIVLATGDGSPRGPTATNVIHLMARAALDAAGGPDID